MLRWLASFPRSGNSFFRVVSKNLFDHEIYSIYPEKRAPVEAIGGLDHIRQSQEIYLLKTHEAIPDQNPAVYLVRDGRDVLVSYAMYTLTSRENPDRAITPGEFQNQLKSVILSDQFGGWSGNVMSWIGRPVTTHLVRFEDLISRPEEVVADSLRTMDMRVIKKRAAKLMTFETLHDRDPHLFRKGKIGDWKDKMTDELHELFWKKHGHAMLAIGYSR